MYTVLAVLCLAALTSAQQNGAQLQDPNAQQQFQQGPNVQVQSFGQQAGPDARAYAAANLQPGQAAIVSLGRPAQGYNAQYQQQGQQNQGQQAQAQGQQVLSAVDASRAQIAAAIAQGANPNNFAIQTNAHYTIAQAPNPQNPDVYQALDALRGRAALTIDEILNILSSAAAGRDYPILNDIPATEFSCEKTHQAGFYADSFGQGACQVIRRCDINGVMTSYLCPNMTLFNQITLVCDWFFNVDCKSARNYYDYSNPRLYTQFPLLDTPANVRGPRPANAQYVAQPAYQPAYSGLGRPL